MFVLSYVFNLMKKEPFRFEKLCMYTSVCNYSINIQFSVQCEGFTQYLDLHENALQPMKGPINASAFIVFHGDFISQNFLRFNLAHEKANSS